ncbi:MAG: alpha/beta hydrolase [Actinomycetota bacterium]|nr:alpha/beta hydrolase [Actinomycetota bacterium]
MGAIPAVLPQERNDRFLPQERSDVGGGVAGGDGGGEIPQSFVGRAAKFRAMESGYVPVGETRIYYEDAGEGQALLFIHAGVADSRMWQGQMGFDGYRTVSFDQRGFGKTGWVPGPYADREDAIAVMDHLGIGSAVIVGCSLGGGIAMHVALASPERVDALVLVGAAARGWEPMDGWPESELWDQVEAASESGDLDTLVELEARVWLAGHGRTLDDIEPALIHLFLEMDLIPAATEKERSKYVEPFEPPVNGRLDEIAVPTLAVVGAHDQHDLIESAWYLADRLSDRPPAIIQNSAHLPSLERPTVFNQVLREFLTTI